MRLVNQWIAEGVVTKIEKDMSGYFLKTAYSEVCMKGDCIGLEVGQRIRIVGILKDGYVYVEHRENVENVDID